MPITKTTVTGPILDATGTAYTNCTINFTPRAVSGDDAADTVIAQSTVSATPDPVTGAFSIDLAPSDTVSYTVSLVVLSPSRTDTYHIGQIYVPAVSPVALEELLPVFSPNVPTNAELLAALSAAVASAEVSAATAQADAAQTALDRVATGADAATSAAAATAAESARDAAIAAGAWDYTPIDGTDTTGALGAITGMVAGETALVLDTMHVWEYDGTNWIDTGESPLAVKASVKSVSEPIAVGKIGGWKNPWWRHGEVGQDFHGRRRWSSLAADAYEIVPSVGNVFNGRALRRKVDGVVLQEGWDIYFDEMGVVAGDEVSCVFVVTGDGETLNLDGRVFISTGAFSGSTAPAALSVVTTATPTAHKITFTVPAGYVGCRLYPWSANGATATTRIEGFQAWKGGADETPDWPSTEVDPFEVENLRVHGDLVFAMPPTIHYVERAADGTKNASKIYFEQLVSALSEDINFDCANLARGQQDADGWYLDIAAGSGVSGGAKIIVRDRESQEAISDLSFSFDATSATAGDGQARDVMFIGDSITNYGHMTDEVLRGNTAGKLAVTLHGTQVPPSRPQTNLIVPPPVVTGNVNEGYPGQRIGFFRGATSPFWNGTADDFAGFCTDNGYPALDDVFIQLGTNDITTVLTDDAFYAAIDGWLDDYEDLVQDVLTQNASLQVGVIPIPTPTLNQDAQGFVYGINLDGARLRRNVLLFNRALIKKFRDRTGQRIHIVPAWSNFDGIYNIQTRLEPRNPFNPFYLDDVASEATQRADLTPNDGHVFLCADSGQYIVKRGKTGFGGYEYASDRDGIVLRADNGVHPGWLGGAQAGRYVRGYLMSKY